MTEAERLQIMGRVILQIQGAGYKYNLGKGFSGWPQVPPPRGTEMNCRAAADLAIKMAKEQGVEGLKLVVTNIDGGFFVPASAGMKALGDNNPPISIGQVRGWEFDKHFRVWDERINKVYDPTFGTSGIYNPVGIKCTKTIPSEFNPKTKTITAGSIYGKYKIVRNGPKWEAEILTNVKAASSKVTDSDYHPQ